MRKAFRHTGVLMMLAVVALGLIGAAYTLWSENMILKTTLQTGNVDVNWSLEPVHPEFAYTGAADETVGIANYPGGPTGAWYHNHVRTPSDTGVQGVTEPAAAKYTHTCDITMGGEGDTTGAAVNPSQHTLNISATGLYPYAGCEFAFDIHNTGTVPVHLTQHVASEVSGSGVHMVVDGVNMIKGTRGANLYDPDPEAQAMCTDVVNMLLTPATAQGLLTWAAPTPTFSNAIQLDAGEQLNCRFWFYLAQDSTENASMNITSTLIAHQWNENIAP